ncbi:hypothetical protein RRG08_032730 [Elysia crispata]|uniref:Uncharacterized protein n=1 Tax=Elysia crispata TaxID=231223 RepID=A0AAE0YV03_9GAST|nr:hypothetical protein RRG08_032730 [Elysia crispata]
MIQSNNKRRMTQTNIVWAVNRNQIDAEIPRKAEDRSHWSGLAKGVAYSFILNELWWGSCGHSSPPWSTPSRDTDMKYGQVSNVAASIGPLCWVPSLAHLEEGNHRGARL